MSALEDASILGSKSLSGGHALESIRHKFAPLSPENAAVTSEFMLGHLKEVTLSSDVVVAGGGMAGTFAALAAARNGVRVILVQDRSRLGGNASSEVRMHIVGANWHKNRPGWRESGLLEEIRLDDAVNNPQRCREMWDVLLYDKVIAEPNITLLLDSALVGAQKDENRITQVFVRSDATEHFYRISAKVFCDCTGDSRLALEAGAETRCGREGRAEFGESLAPEVADKETLGSSILFTSRRLDRPSKFTPPLWARKIDTAILKRRTIKSWEYGYWWIEWGGHLNTINDNQRIRFELLSIVMGVWDHIKNSGEHPDSANWVLDWVGMVPGKRESRRIVGDHILTEGDLLSGGNFEDEVAIGGWPMDDHPPGGFDSTDASPGSQVATQDVYGIPLRSLYSRNITNLMMAGRNISASHVAFTSTRVMGTCSVMGQAVGTAAAQCVRNGLLPRDLYTRKGHLRELQQSLLRDDQTLKNIRHEDSFNLAPLATVTASAQEPDALAVNAINGWSRDFPGASALCLPEQDVPLEMCGQAPAEKRTQHWAGAMGPEGAWFELQWPDAQHLSGVELIFDTGFHRELTLTSSDFINQGIIRGPQPETVRDYDIIAIGEDGTTHCVAKVTDNYQRLRRHHFSVKSAKSLRVHVRATNGDRCARIFEVRCYTRVQGEK